MGFVMFEIVLLALFGSVAIASLTGAFDTNSTSDDDVDDEPDIIEPDEETEYSQSPVIIDVGYYDDEEELAALGSTLIGSHGDDVVDIDVGDIDFLVEIDLGSGDDTVDVRTFYTPDALNVYGGEGSDNLDLSTGDSDSARLLFYGGAGDDVISAGGDRTFGFGDDGADELYGYDGSVLYGGDGDDVLDGEDVESWRYSRGRAAYGGDGDDTLMIERTAGEYGTDEDTFGEWVSSSDQHYGGEGADTFNLALSVNSAIDVFFDEPDQNLLTLSDFTAGEDVLIVELSRAVETIEIINGDTDTRIEFTYALEIYGEDDTVSVTSYITLGDPDVTADDVVFNTP